MNGSLTPGLHAPGTVSRLSVASSLACSRRSDLSWGQRAKMLAEEKKRKTRGGVGSVPSSLSLSPSFPPYFFLALAKLHYPNAWIRLVSRGHFKLITQGKLKKPLPSSAETWIIFTNMPCQFFFLSLIEKNQYFGKHLFYKTRTDYAGEKLVLGLRI